MLSVAPLDVKFKSGHIFTLWEPLKTRNGDLRALAPTTAQLRSSEDVRAPFKSAGSQSGHPGDTL